MIISPREIDFQTFVIADVPANPEPFRLLNRVPIRDNGEPLVDLRLAVPELSFADYCLPYVRESVAEALRVALRHLPDKYDLRIFTALRTLEQQAEMYWGNYRRAQEEHPDWPTATLRRMTNRFFAPPDAKAPPGHCTGGAVDVGLFDRATGEGIDVRSPLEGWTGAPTAVEGLSPESAENRRLLCFVMHATGLSNCRDEFWHWSYGDSAWAVRMGEPIAVYGAIDAPADATRVRGSKLVLSESQSDWPLQFESIRDRLLDKLNQQLPGHPWRIEHVGSTAVPGLIAKPILDIDILIPASVERESVVAALAELGYESRGDQGIAGRAAFRYQNQDVPLPAHHLYAGCADAKEMRRHLAFRDYLRQNERAATAYGSLKQGLADQFPWDRDRYSAAKTPFVSGILAEIDPDLISQD